MVFSTKKRTGKYIETSLGNCDILCGEALDAWVTRLKEGDIAAIKPTVIGHVRLAIRIAGQYCRKPSSEQEMVSAAMEALLDGCYAVLKGKPLLDNNITGYLICLIHSRLNRKYCEDHVVRVPVSTLIRARKEGRIILLPSFEKLKSVPSRFVNLFDLRELIYSCCFSNMEETVIKMREQNYNNTEIGEILGISKMRISQIMAIIRERFNQKIKELSQ